MSQLANKIIIIGGSFNPVHLGHLKLLALACQQEKAAEILLLPAAVSPFKLNADFSFAAYRRCMLEAALNDVTDLTIPLACLTTAERRLIKKMKEEEKIKICDLDLQSLPPSYTINTLRKLQKQYPHAKLIMMGGSDLLPSLGEWHEPEKLAEIADFLLVTRPGYGQTDSAGGGEKKFNFKIKTLIADMPDVSSAALRRQLENLPLLPPYNITALTPAVYNGITLQQQPAYRDLSNYLTPATIAYIAQQRLYQQPDWRLYLSGAEQKLFGEILLYLGQHLNWQRYTHCLNVMNMAAALTLALEKSGYDFKTAKSWENLNLIALRQNLKNPFAAVNVNSSANDAVGAAKLSIFVRQALITGLFHDACKYEKLTDYPELAARLSKADLACTQMQHGPIAAYVLQQKFACRDELVLNALYYHTTLRPQATWLDKVVYIADKLEFGRRYSDVPLLRQSLNSGYDESIKKILRKCISINRNKRAFCHPLSQAALDDLQNNK